jgi:uncharacterized protein YjbJ (UPF0337 family)
MSESRTSKIGELKARLSEITSDAEGEVDAGAFIARIRETVGNTISDVDAEAVATRLKATLGQVEEKIDATKAKEFIASLDAEKLTGLLDEARTRAEPATRRLEAQGERIAENLPGAVDKLMGAAKEKLGELTGDEELAHAGELDQLRGQIKEKFADAGETEEATRDGGKERH